jgi:hypothetical protein
MYPNPVFCPNYYLHNWYRVKFSPKIYVIFKTLPKVNNRPMGEHSPNLVTLMLNQVVQTA